MPIRLVSSFAYRKNNIATVRQRTDTNTQKATQIYIQLHKYQINRHRHFNCTLIELNVIYARKYDVTKSVRVIWLGAKEKNWCRIFRAFSLWLNWLHCGIPQAAPNVIFFSMCFQFSSARRTANAMNVAPGNVSERELKPQQSSLEIAIKTLTHTHTYNPKLAHKHTKSDSTQKRQLTDIYLDI